MKIILLLILGLLVLLPISAETWTVLVYMAADNSLWNNAVQDMNDMESVALPANLNLIVQTDMPSTSAYPGGQRRKIRQDSAAQITSPVIANLGNIDSGDPSTLNAFVNWGFGLYPGQRKMLVIWGHGDNWFKDSEAKWICPDNDAQSRMNVAAGDLRAALEGIPHLDILLFDACSMQSLEVLGEVMDAADYVIGSEELVPTTGFPYQTMIPLFASYSVPEIAALIPQKYVESYEDGGIQNPHNYSNPITCSSIRTSALAVFYQAFREFCRSYDPLWNAGTATARESCWEMNTGYNDVDVGELLALLADQTEYAGSLEQTVLQDLQAKWDASVLWSGSQNIPHDVGSAALWMPRYREFFDVLWSYYGQLNFAQYRWLSLLNRWYGDDVAPAKPGISDAAVILGTLQFKITQPADPDSLWYRVTLQQDNSAEAEENYYYSEFGVSSFYVQIHVQDAGSVTVRCSDGSGNWADSTFVYEFPASRLQLLVAPNPVRDRSLASVRWYLPEGKTGKVELSLYNLRGQKVMEKLFIQDEEGPGFWLLSAEKDFHTLGRGIYILRLRIKDDSLHQKLTIL